MSEHSMRSPLKRLEWVLTHVSAVSIVCAWVLTLFICPISAWMNFILSVHEGSRTIKLTIFILQNLIPYFYQHKLTPNKFLTCWEWKTNYIVMKKLNRQRALVTSTIINAMCMNLSQFPWNFNEQLTVNRAFFIQFRPAQSTWGYYAWG